MPVCKPLSRKYHKTYSVLSAPIIDRSITRTVEQPKNRLFTVWPLSASRISPNKNLLNPKEEVTMEDTVNEESELDTETAELEKKLKACDPDIQQYVADLTAINTELHKKNIKCLADKKSLQNRIKVLEKELSERPQKAETGAEILKRLQGSVVNLPPEFQHIVEE
jgi:chromosome segregation ATPase